jgi:hypothetical protein
VVKAITHPHEETLAEAMEELVLSFVIRDQKSRHSRVDRLVELVERRQLGPMNVQDGRCKIEEKF